MIRKESCTVEVFERFESPTAIGLKNASPSKKVTVTEYTGNHTSSFAANTLKPKRSNAGT